MAHEGGRAHAPGLAVRATAVAQVFVDDPSHPAVSPEDLHHLTRVLRLRRDEAVVASDGAGSWSLCRYRGPDTATDDALSVEEPTVFEQRLGPAVTVAFAPVKGERPEWVVQKLTELGVDRIVTIETERSVVRRKGERSEQASARLRRIAEQAAGQSRQVWLPDVIDNYRLDGLSDLVGEPDEPGSVPPVCLAQLGGDRPTGGTRLIAVGPEGGFSPDELARGVDRGYGTVGLVGGVLRAETAAVAAGVLLTQLRAGTVAEMGDS